MTIGLLQVTKEDLAAHVRQRLEAEQLEKERQRREKEESHLHTVIRVARDKDLKAQIGQGIYFDLVDHEKARGLAPSFDYPFIKQEVLRIVIPC